ncbi:hypothetical protein JAAARDRAFT_74864 [Jaapia argillacea MUCL 33604]|uniref:HAM1-like N-terminal domain-containing protein n=1 Tax=Jaapia argillacea MUCL 33604 TaxID=933084 RepID=A0A067QCW3_9AGAM|nr:hypothetical protein JAAARDRAFT_74864 [Jaapia argillacea MUCL 33604]
MTSRWMSEDSKSRTHPQRSPRSGAMGFCFSCCRRQKRSQEQDPLLPQRHVNREHEDADPPPHSNLEKLAHVLAALNVQKLPSQDQINRILQLALRSDLLGNVDAGKLGAGYGYGPLSQSGRKVVADVRLVLDAVAQIGLEKNDDDKLQDLIFHTEQIDSSSVNADIAVNVRDENLPQHVEVVANELPTRSEVQSDTGHLLHSIKSLARLLITSSTFRLILSDVFLMAREMLADVATEVSRAAIRVEAAAENVRAAVKPQGWDRDQIEDSANELGENVNRLAEVAKERVNVASALGPERVKEVAIARLQEVMVRAHQNPQYRSALQTILLIIRKYSHKLGIISQTIHQSTNASPSTSAAPITFTPVVWTDEHISHALEDTKILLERLASGYQLDPLLRTITATISDITTNGSESVAIKQCFASFGNWVDESLANPAFSTSFLGTQSIQAIYDECQRLLDQERDSPWSRDVREFMNEATTFLDRIQNDRSTMKLVGAIEALAEDARNLGRDALTAGSITSGKWRQELKRDAMAWLVPRILTSLIGRVIPMPRVEYKDSSMEAVLDSMYLSFGTGDEGGLSLLPDHIRVQNWSELRLDILEDGLEQNGNAGYSGPGSVQSVSRVRLYMDGIRMASTSGVGYYVNYQYGSSVLGVPLGFGYQDEGLVSIDFGEGVMMDVEVEIGDLDEPNSWISSWRERSDGEGEALFRVTDVKLSFPGLSFSIDRSKHWILNKVVLQPLSGPAVRYVLKSVLEGQIKGALDNLGLWVGRIQKDANAKALEQGNESVGLEEYWDAVLGRAGRYTEQDDFEETTDAEEDGAPAVETHIKPTLKGLVRTTITQAEPTSSHPPTPDEAVIAIGVGPQVVQHSAGPYGEDRIEEGIMEVVDVVVDSVEQTAEQAKEAAYQAREAAVKAREDVEKVEQRVEIVQRVEGRKKDWRSKAFDV